MRDVTVSRSTGAPLEAVEAALSPEAIIDYAGTFDILSVEDQGESQLLTAIQNDLEIELHFQEIDGGYRYAQLNDQGPFEEMVTRIWVERRDTTLVTAHCSFTFGSMWAFVIDRIAARARRQELERLLRNLLADIERDGSGTDRSTRTTEHSSGVIADIPDDEGEWAALLTKKEFEVLRCGGTETPFSGRYVNVFDAGIYRCAGCGTALFDSQAKFKHSCGWPSFSDVIERDRIEYRKDSSHGRKAVEVICAQCDGHLGHLFDDGPEPTGKRYCINSTALRFDSVDED